MTRKLDYLMYDRVIGLTVNPESRSWQDGYGYEDTYYSKDIATVWPLIEKVASNLRLDVEIEVQVKRDALLWSVVINPMVHQGQAIADTAPLAICIAILRAVGVDEVEIQAALEES